MRLWKVSFRENERSALTDGQIASFAAQGLYYNVHSATNPGGEIRGEIVPSAAALTTDTGNPATSNNFSTLLSGAQEVPSNTSSATGYSTVALNPVTKTISGTVVTSGIVGTGAHIHDGLAGQNGPIIVPLAGGPAVWTVPAGTTLTDAQIAKLTAGEYYINVHTAALPNGAIRGQLNLQVRFALVAGSNEVPPVITANQISGSVRSSGISGTAAHIHEAPAGVNGDLIVPLTETPAGSGVWVVPAGQVLTAGQAASFNAGDLYYNVHSAANPGGEIRGQILPATVRTGSAALDGSK